MVPPGFQPAVVASRSVPDGGAGVDPVGERDRGGAAGAVGVADGERSAWCCRTRRRRRRRARMPVPAERDGLAVGDDVVRVAGRDVRPGDRQAVVQQRLAGRERVRGQAGGGERVADAVEVPGRGVRRGGDADVVEGLLPGWAATRRWRVRPSPRPGRRPLPVAAGAGPLRARPRRRRLRARHSAAPRPEQGRAAAVSSDPPGSSGAPPHGGRRCGAQHCLTARAGPAFPGDGLAVTLAVTRPARLFFKRFRLFRQALRASGRRPGPGTLATAVSVRAPPARGTRQRLQTRRKPHPVPFPSGHI